MKLKVFYSWQTTTTTKYNKNFILSCIKKAVRKIRKKPVFSEVDFEIIEGVTGESGSPSVATKITDERIPGCDIFIADLSVVNQISKANIWVQKYIFKNEFKPFQNNNVMNEHGVALHALGVEKIIGVLNSEYGSPKENPDNIPFDLTHLRFPIEYKYSAKSKNSDKIGDQLVNDLCSALKTTAIYVIQNQKSKYKPLIVWSEWEKSLPIFQQFYWNEKIEDIKKTIHEGLNYPKESMRLLGLSGLGKTRILLEIFRAQANDKESILLNSRILYLNYNLYQSIDLQAIFYNLKENDENKIVLLDNCSESEHRQLLHFINNDNNRIILITIDSNPEEFEQNRINGVNYINIKKEDLSSVVSKILTEDFSSLRKETIERIKDFSQGIPLMAVLIGESIKKGEKFVGKLADKELLNKLLGKKGKETRCRTVLKSCAIFKYFGFEDDLSSQIEFIATNKNISSLNGDNQVIINEFNEICKLYLKREIFEKKGRLIGMRPFPLAMSLTQEWLEACTPKRILGVIKDITNLNEQDRNQLSESLAEQMKYLGYSKKANSIIEKIVGPNSPFDNAEVLNTELGSRLFRAFVEVNPIAISQNLVRVFSSKSVDELLRIKEGRRNIVWVLEKTCFDKRTFCESVKVLYAFAVSENESWSNNATGQFLHLFNIFLSGTEASLKERWEIIEWGLSQKVSGYSNLALNAMTIGLNYGPFTRSMGAEKQGTKILNDNKPEGVEIVEYWTNILKKLTMIVKSKSEYTNIASDIIANCIRSICHAKLTHLIIPFIEEMAKYKENDWDEALKGLKLAKKYEQKLLSEEELTRINQLIKSLTKTDFANRYRTIASSYFLEYDESYTSDNVINKMIKLADEFIESNLSWEENFSLFYKDQQVFSFHFGKRLYENLKESKEKVEEFIKYSLKTILSIKKEERVLVVLGGFISESDALVKKKFYNNIFSNNELKYLLFYFISIDSEGKKYFDLLFILVNKGKYNVKCFKELSYGSVLKTLDLKALNKLGEQLFKYGEDGYATVFDLYAQLCVLNDELNKDLLPILKNCIIKLGVGKKIRKKRDEYLWVKTICLVLENENESEFAIFINNSVIDSITLQNSYHLDNDIRSIYRILMKRHFQSIWDVLSETLLSKDDDYVKFYGLKNILGSTIGGFAKGIGILFEGDIDLILKWCQNNKPLAPARLAELVPIFAGNNDDYSAWHPISLKLIDNYGDNKDVLRSLSVNMGNYSWIGSIVPLLEGEKKLFISLKDHKLNTVSDWANKYLSFIDKKIEREKQEDEETYL